MCVHVHVRMCVCHLGELFHGLEECGLRGHGGLFQLALQRLFVGVGERGDRTLSFIGLHTHKERTKGEKKSKMSSSSQISPRSRARKVAGNGSH